MIVFNELIQLIKDYKYLSLSIIQFSMDYLSIFLIESSINDITLYGSLSISAFSSIFL